MPTRKQAPTAKPPRVLTPEEFEAGLADAYEETPVQQAAEAATTSPRVLSPEEFEAGLRDVYPEEPSAFGALFGPLLEGFGNMASAPGIVGDVLSTTQPTTPGGRFGPMPSDVRPSNVELVPQEGDRQAGDNLLSGGLRGIAQEIYPEEERGRGGYVESTLAALGGTTPSLVTGAMTGGTGLVASAAAQIGVPLYYEILDKTGDKDKAMLGLLAAVPVATLERAGVGGVALKLARKLRRINDATGGAVEKFGVMQLLKTPATETGQEVLEQGLVDKVQELLTGEDLANWQRMQAVVEPSSTIGLLFGGAEVGVGRLGQALDEVQEPGAADGDVQTEEPPPPVSLGTAAPGLAPEPVGGAEMLGPSGLESGARVFGTEGTAGPLEARGRQQRLNALAGEVMGETAPGVIQGAPAQPRKKTSFEQAQATASVQQELEEFGKTPRAPADSQKVKAFYDKELKPLAEKLGVPKDYERAALDRLWNAERPRAEARRIVAEWKREAGGKKPLAARIATSEGEGEFLGPEEPGMVPPVTPGAPTKAAAGLAQPSSQERKGGLGQGEPLAAAEALPAEPSVEEETAGPDLAPKPEQAAPKKKIVEMHAGGLTGVMGKANITTGKVVKALKKIFISGGFKPSGARREIEKAGGFERAEMLEAGRSIAKIDRAMRKAVDRNWRNSDHAKVVDEAFEGEAAAIRALPSDEVRLAVAEARAHLDRLIRQQVKAGGVIDPKTAPDLARKILASQGTYARRSYQAHMDPEWADKVDPAVRQRLFDLWNSWAQPLSKPELEILRKQSLERTPAGETALKRRREITREIAKLQKGDPRIAQLREERRALKPKVKERTAAASKAKQELVGRRQFAGMSEADIHSEMDVLLAESREMATSPWKAIATDKLGRKDLSIYKRRKDIPKELRAFLGEIEDPLANYAQSVAKISSVLAKHEAFTEIRRQGLGKWLHEKPKGPHVVRISAEKAPGLRPLEGLYTTPEIKEALTEVTPADVHWLMKAGLRANSAIKWGKVLGQPWSFMRNLLSNVGLVTANGHLPSFYRGKEWKAAFGKLGDIDEQKRLVRLGVVGDSISATEWGDLRGALRSDPGKVGQETTIKQKFTDAVEAWYQAADNAPKIRFFYAEEAALKKAGYSAAEAESLAADRTRDLMPTPERMGAFLKGMRKQFILGNFFSFHAEILRTTGNRLRLIAQELKSKNPAVRRMGAKRAIGQVVAAAAIPGMTSFLNSLNGVDSDEDKDRREFVPLWDKASRILWLGDETIGQYFDFSDLDPFTMFTDPVMRVLGGADADEAMGEWAREEGRAFFGWSPVAQLAIDISTGKDKQGKPIDDMVEHVKKQVQPGFVSAAQRADEKGVAGEATAIVTGTRRYDFDVEKSLGFDVRRFGAEISDTTKSLTRQAKKSPEEKERFKAAAEKERKQLFEELSRKVQAATRLGVPVRQIQGMLRDSLSKKVAAAVLAGEYIEWDEPKDWLKE